MFDVRAFTIDSLSSNLTDPQRGLATLWTSTASNLGPCKWQKLERHRDLGPIPVPYRTKLPVTPTRINEMVRQPRYH